MITEKENTRLSKFLSYLLRHNPAELDIVLDSNGWTSTDELIKKIQTKEPQFSFAVLEYIVNTNNKKRFSFNDDKSMIMASQGHSVTVDLNYAPAQPPEFLFHGTA
ncbi:MAG: RNA 2'-phosphotransferase, partial [Bacteroidetes bacterium]|nr:RNA 2'-phosphotransferase [Bacteroidota bacterium]